MPGGTDMALPAKKTRSFSVWASGATETRGPGGTSATLFVSDKWMWVKKSKMEPWHMEPKIKTCVPQWSNFDPYSNRKPLVVPANLFEESGKPLVVLTHLSHLWWTP